jgi:hypothetical protein
MIQGRIVWLSPQGQGISMPCLNENYPVFRLKGDNSDDAVTRQNA